MKDHNFGMDAGAGGHRGLAPHRVPHHYLPAKHEPFPDEAHSRGAADDPMPPPPPPTLEQQHNPERAIVPVPLGDGASIEVARRRRGRPPGSKNKPKPPVVITREADPSSAMRPHILEIPGGRDVVDAVARFACRRSLGVCVLAGTGAVSDVTLRHPPETIRFHGRFEILSISATLFPPSMAAISPASAAMPVSVSLAGSHGQIVGGIVAGPLVAAGAVVLVVAAFSSPTFHRLPVEEDMSVSVSVSGSGDHHGDPDQRTSVMMDPFARHSAPPPSDVMWPPAPPQPPF